MPLPCGKTFAFCVTGRRGAVPRENVQTHGIHICPTKLRGNRLTPGGSWRAYARLREHAKVNYNCKVKTFKPQPISHHCIIDHLRRLLSSPSVTLPSRREAQLWNILLLDFIFVEKLFILYFPSEVFAPLFSKSGRGVGRRHTYKPHAQTYKRIFRN